MDNQVIRCYINWWKDVEQVVPVNKNYRGVELTSHTLKLCEKIEYGLRKLQG